MSIFVKLNYFHALKNYFINYFKINLKFLIYFQLNFIFEKINDWIANFKDHLIRIIILHFLIQNFNPHFRSFSPNNLNFHQNIIFQYYFLNHLFLFNFSLDYINYFLNIVIRYYFIHNHHYIIYLYLKLLNNSYFHNFLDLNLFFHHQIIYFIFSQIEIFKFVIYSILL